jgi:ABC-type multidrug transport system fused ATPase/permease subunit
MIACCVAGAMAESLQPYIIKVMVDTLGTAKDIHETKFLHNVVTIGLSFALLRIFIVAIWFVFQSLRYQVEPNVEAAARDSLLQHILRHPQAWFLNGFAGRTGQAR